MEQTTALHIECSQPLYLSERDSGGKWAVKADASICLDCKNVSGEPLLIGPSGIQQIQFRLPVTDKKEVEERADLIAAKYTEELAGSCEGDTWTVKKGEITAENYLPFYVEAVKDGRLASGDSFQILIQHLNAFCLQESMSYITAVYIDTDGTEKKMDIPVYKKQSPLAIKRFQVDTTQVGMGDVVHITWETLGADVLQLQPFGEVLSEAAGSIALKIWDSCRIVLRISRERAGIQKELEIQVVEGQSIQSFTAEPAIAPYGKEVVFRWGINNASHAYISNGVGRVEADSKAWLPGTSSGNFVLHCLKKENGKDVVTSKAVYAGQEDVLEIMALDFICISKPSQETAQYNLNWFVANCSEIQIKTSDGKEITKGECMGNASFQGKNLTLELFCKGEHGQEIHLTKIKPK